MKPTPITRRPSPRKPSGLALGVAASALGTTLAACGTSSPPAPSVPAPASNPWLQPVPAGTVGSPDGAGIVARLARSGPPVALLYEFGTPVFEAAPDSPRRTVRCTRPWGTCELQDAPVPMPDDAQPSPGSDGALVVVDRSADGGAGAAYEFFEARRQPDGNWVTGWASATPLAGDGRQGETGSGTSLLSGLIRTDEIRNGRIDHALQVASKFTCRDRTVYPAVKTDGKDTAPDCIPMGTRLQIDPALDLDALTSLSPAERTIAQAWQRYGAYVQNSAGAPLVVGFESPAGESDPYPAAGLPYDYAALTGIPLPALRVVAPA